MSQREMQLFNAFKTVDGMYHVKDGKKYIGEKYDMQKPTKFVINSKIN